VRGASRGTARAAVQLLGLGTALAVWAVAATASGPPERDAEAPVALAGDWYVLVHYRDEEHAEAPDQAVPDPEQLFWDDEVWRLEERDGALVWTRHPHVTLDDPSGRYTSLPSGRKARTTGAWSPSPAQLDEVRDGLEPDPQEARTRTLRGSPERGYRSTGQPRAASASAITYGEQWSIGGLPARPEFVREDTLASARAGAAEGRTVFTTREVLAGGDELRGTYARDGVLSGRFRMIRIRLAEQASR